MRTARIPLLALPLSAVGALRLRDERVTKSKQAPLISLRVSTGHESFTEGCEFLRRIVSADFLYLGACELITTFVIRVPSMPFKPLPTDAVPGSDLIKLSPQVIVLDGFTVYGAPVVGLPT